MSIFEEGARDRRNGATIWQNPFATFTRGFSEWEDGWLHQNERLRKGDTVPESNGDRDRG